MLKKKKRPNPFSHLDNEDLFLEVLIIGEQLPTSCPSDLFKKDKVLHQLVKVYVHTDSSSQDIGLFVRTQIHIKGSNNIMFFNFKSLLCLGS